MRNIKSVELLVCYADNTKIIWDTNDLNKTHFEDPNLIIDIDIEDTGLCNEITTTVKAKAPVPIKYIEFCLTPQKDFANEDLYYLFNGHGVNEFVSIRRFIEANCPIHKEITVMKNKATGEALNIAFSTLDRFVTRFFIDGKYIRLRHEMEDKALDPKKSYRLEKILFNSSDAIEFLEYYAELIGTRYQARRDKAIPTGWCSWSYYYHSIDHKKILNSIEEMRPFTQYGANIIQMDDGWQTNDVLAGNWVYDTQRFPNGIEEVVASAEQAGMLPGIWMAPFLIDSKSPFFEQCIDALIQDKTGHLAPPIHNDNIYAIDISKKEGLKLIYDNFYRARHVYGFKYFKLDFLLGGITKAADEGRDFLIYNGEYCIWHYRNAIQTVRDAVGEESIIVGCGTLMPENTGIFDAMRVGQDITWGRSKDFPTQWEIITQNSRNVFLRYFYHRHMYINDADALVLRDYHIGDGFSASYEEVKTWATVIALSGGSVLINEIISKLSDERLKLFTSLLPPYGVAAKPVDYFEYPTPTRTHLVMQGQSQIISFFNWGNTLTDMEIELSSVGINRPVIAVNTWTKELIGICKNKLLSENVMLHGSESYLVQPISPQPEFIFTEGNFYCGADRILSEYNSDTMTLRLFTVDGKEYPACGVCVSYPDTLIPQGNHTAVETKGDMELLNPVEVTGIVVSRFIPDCDWSSYTIQFSRKEKGFCVNKI